MFNRESLRDWLNERLSSTISGFRSRSDDAVLERSVDDTAAELLERAGVEPLVLHLEIVDGGVDEATRRYGPDAFGDYGTYRATIVTAELDFDGSPELWEWQASTYSMTPFAAEVRLGERRVVLSAEHSGNPEAGEVKTSFDQQIQRLQELVGYTNKDVEVWLGTLEPAVRSTVERRRQEILDRHGLAAELGFPIRPRDDAPRRVPIERKQLTVTRPRLGPAKPFKPEHALTPADYEEVVEVILGTLRAMERSPSTASGSEEDLRDQILVQLNGTFRGAATGETFVRSGKTDILVRVEDRHVFVGECKWWSGTKACGEAVDQLLRYLPWRDEKAALILFIDRKDATAVIEKAEGAVREHSAWKRAGARSDDPSARRNHVLCHPEDPAREIYLAMLFGVLTQDGGRD